MLGPYWAGQRTAAGPGEGQPLRDTWATETYYDDVFWTHNNKATKNTNKYNIIYIYIYLNNNKNIYRYVYIYIYIYVCKYTTHIIRRYNYIYIYTVYIYIHICSLYNMKSSHKISRPQQFINHSQANIAMTLAIQLSELLIELRRCFHFTWNSQVWGSRLECQTYPLVI